MADKNQEISPKKREKLKRQRWLAYGRNPAIRQFDANACWAACLEWWSKACGGGRPTLPQEEIASTYVKLWNKSEGKDYGAMSITNMATILREPQWRASVQCVERTQLSFEFLCKKLLSGPLFAAFYYQAGDASHVNVIVAPAVRQDKWREEFIGMEPWDGRYKVRSSSFFSGRGMMIAVPQ